MRFFLLNSIIFPVHIHNYSSSIGLCAFRCSAYVLFHQHYFRPTRQKPNTRLLLDCYRCWCDHEWVYSNEPMTERSIDHKETPPLTTLPRTKQKQYIVMIRMFQLMVVFSGTTAVMRFVLLTVRYYLPFGFRQRNIMSSDLANQR